MRANILLEKGEKLGKNKKEASGGSLGYTPTQAVPGSTAIQSDFSLGKTTSVSVGLEKYRCGKGRNK